MKPGKYSVQSWNNKDGILLNEEGDFVNVTKSDLDAKLNGKLEVGAEVMLTLEMIVRPVESLLKFATEDEKARYIFSREIERKRVQEKQEALIEAENKRRSHYGAKPL
jgi:hypothetical protein